MAQDAPSHFFKFSKEKSPVYPDTPFVPVCSAGGEGDKVGHILKHVETADTAREGEPGLHAHIGGVGAGLVPEAHVWHLGEGDGDAAPTAFGLDGDLPADVAKDQGVVVEKVVAQGDGVAVFQRAGESLAADETFRGEEHLLRGAFPAEAQAVVLKAKPLLHGDVEAGVPAKTEVHLPVVQILHLVCYLQKAVTKLIYDTEDELSGVDFISFIIPAKLQHKPRPGVLRLTKVPVAGDAVDSHFMDLAIQGVAALREPCHEGEDVVGAALPVFWVALPEILGVVGAEEGLELRAAGGGSYGEKVVFYCVNHGNFSLFCDFYSGFVILYVYFMILYVFLIFFNKFLVFLYKNLLPFLYKY